MRSRDLVCDHTLPLTSQILPQRVWLSLISSRPKECIQPHTALGAAGACPCGVSRCVAGDGTHPTPSVPGMPTARPWSQRPTVVDNHLQRVWRTYTLGEDWTDRTGQVSQSSWREQQAPGTGLRWGVSGGEMGSKLQYPDV